MIPGLKELIAAGSVLIVIYAIRRGMHRGVDRSGGAAPGSVEATAPAEPAAPTIQAPAPEPDLPQIDIK